VTLVYDGLTPVPFTFLSGVVFDGEGLDEIKSAKEVVLAVSVSYPVRSEYIATTFSHPVRPHEDAGPRIIALVADEAERSGDTVLRSREVT
jgi:hypothetical protein